MLPKITPSSLPSTTNAKSDVQEEKSSEQKEFASHIVEQKESLSVPSPEPIIDINPTVKQEQASLSISQREVSESKPVNKQAVLEQQISGLLREANLKGFELSLDSISFPSAKTQPKKIEAQITCSTSYDNRKNVDPVLEKVHSILLPVLQSFIEKYEVGASSSLSKEEQASMREKIQQVVAEHMPKSTPTLDSMLRYVNSIPVFSLSPQYTAKEESEELLVAVESILKQYKTPGVIIAMKAEVVIDEETVRKADVYEIRRKQQAQEERMKKKSKKAGDT